MSIQYFPISHLDCPYMESITSKSSQVFCPFIIQCLQLCPCTVGFGCCLSWPALSATLRSCDVYWGSPLRLVVMWGGWGLLHCASTSCLPRRLFSVFLTLHSGSVFPISSAWWGRFGARGRPARSPGWRVCGASRSPFGLLVA